MRRVVWIPVLCLVAVLAIGVPTWAEEEAPRGSAIERATAAVEAAAGAGDHERLAKALVVLAEVTPDHARTQALLRRALVLYEQLGDRAGVAEVLHRLGVRACGSGDYARALTMLEQALEAHAALGDAAGTVADRIALGRIHRTLGNLRRAREILEQAQTMESELPARDALRRARLVEELGLVREAQGDLAEGRALLEQAVALYAAIQPGDRVSELRATQRVATLHERAGRNERALAAWSVALALAEGLGESHQVARAWFHLGRLYRRTGRLEMAAAFLERAVRANRRTRLAPDLLLSLQELAGLRLDVGESAKALATALEALSEVERLLAGLGDTEGSRAHAPYRELYGIGVRAALAAGEIETAVVFRESGRAAGLLAGLAGREALRHATIPKALRQAEQDARAAGASARRRLADAADRANLRDVRRGHRAVRAAQARTLEIAGRIQREMKRQVGLFSPRAAPLDEIQSRLEPHDALVLYDLGGGESLALVITATDARAVSLGPTAAIEAVARTLSTWDETDATERAARRLRALLAEPLGLGETVRRVLISPSGVLFRVPLALLFPARAPCLVPSGTSYVLLRAQVPEERGTRVLALGDPVWRMGQRGVVRIGRRWPRLPATRTEAEAVGDVVLLGEEATEDGLLEAVAKEVRWRVVHLACHGLIDTERPSLSAVVMTPSAREDGLLTALEICRLHVPADLVVLSVDQSARGLVVPGEGLLGLPRAFLQAGASRVLGSIGHVDDEATAALMIRFHELLDPKEVDTDALGAAEALQQAQAFVRQQQRWRHPRYWASWVLWGLP